MDAARLSVVQPGTRANFMRRVVDAMRALVPAPATFFCLGTNEARAYAEGARVVDGASAPMPPCGTLSEAFGLDARSLVSSGRRAYLADELYPEAVRATLPYFATTRAAGLVDAVFVFLHEGGLLFGVVGLERRAADPPFELDEVARLEALSPFVVSAARAQLAFDDVSREATALRALLPGSSTLLVLDRDGPSVLWAANRERGVDWDADIAPHVRAIADATEQALAAKRRGDALPTPPALPFGTIAGVARLEGDPVFAGARCAVVRVQSLTKAKDAAKPLEGLSRREREIARLLVAGYSGVNVAAIAGLSENTVRTYVRRLYAKLGVVSRAELVRTLVAPESARPSTVLAPPPDSALAVRDDTLD
jgi:DNA-binding CsgD family transcriptional regulator